MSTCDCPRQDNRANCCKLIAATKELDALKVKVANLESLAYHCWVHDGYPNNGYLQMTTQQKATYDGLLTVRV